MKILILDDSTFTGANLLPGYYNIEPAAEGTDQQRKAFWALIDEFFYSNCHSYNVKNPTELYKKLVKDVFKIEETFMRDWTRSGKPCEPFLDTRFKGLSEWNKKERQLAIDRLIAVMDMAQVQTKRYYEILAGMQENSMRAAG